MKPFYITTAIAYPNGLPHVGHAYEAIVTDAIARSHRLSGREVFFQTGTDEHGQKMLRTAEQAGTSPRDLANKGAHQFRSLYDQLDISYDRFIRTTQGSHLVTAQALWQAMARNGDIYKDVYKGWYSVRDERYFDETETLVSPEPNPIRSSIETGNPVEWQEEESYFFRLSRYRFKLLDWLQENPKAIQPTRAFNEMQKVLNEGLNDISISRTQFNWGVPVPGDPEHVMYVWVDALANYLTGTGYPRGNVDDRWPADLHMIGKDITRFHAIYWPAFLMSAKLSLPQTLFAHGFILDKGRKLSKSDEVVNQITINEFVDKVTPDGLRYFLLRDIPLGNDGEYDLHSLETRVNADLANNVGNLVSRVLGIIRKNYPDGITRIANQAADATILNATLTLGYQVETLTKNLELSKALARIMEVTTVTNQYIQATAPWSEEDDLRKSQILLTACDAIRTIAVCLAWATPTLSETILDQLGIRNDQRLFDSCRHRLTTVKVSPNAKVVFPRLVF